MMDSSAYKVFGGCITPIRTFNRWTHEEMFVPCGKCVACLNASASKQSNRVREEINKHKYSMMFTLTYDNQFIPRWERFLDSNDCPQIRPIGRVENMFNSCPLNYFDKVKGKWNIDFDTYLPAIQGDCDGDTFATCCKKDVQNFIKRVRFWIDNLNIIDDDKKIRYFIASEYGPQTYRPHYHGILFFDNEVILREIKDIIVRSWGQFERVRGQRNSFHFRPFAHIHLTKDYIKLCDANTAYYVAEYVSGNLGLPQVLDYKCSRPFHVQSKSPVIGCYKVDREEILENVYRGTYRVGREVYNRQSQQFEHFDIPLNSDLCNSLFRKCKGYSDLSFDSKLQLYSFYSRHRAEWREDLETSIIYYSNSSAHNSVYEISETDYLRKFPIMKYRNWLKRWYESEYNLLDMDTDQNWYCSRHAWRITHLVNFARFYPYVDDIHSYVMMLDRFDVLRKSDQLIQFYTLFNDLVDEVGFQPAMLDAYPLLSENMPMFGDSPIDMSNPYVRVFLDELCEFGDFYTYGKLDYYKVVFNSICSTSFFEVYVNQQLQRLDKRNKSKKLNNSVLFGSRKID